MEDFARMGIEGTRAVGLSYGIVFGKDRYWEETRRDWSWYW